MALCKRRCSVKSPNSVGHAPELRRSHRNGVMQVTLFCEIADFGWARENPDGDLVYCKSMGSRRSRGQGCVIITRAAFPLEAPKWFAVSDCVLCNRILRVDWKSSGGDLMFSLWAPLVGRWQAT